MAGASHKETLPSTAVVLSSTGVSMQIFEQQITATAKHLIVIHMQSQAHGARVHT